MKLLREQDQFPCRMTRLGKITLVNYRAILGATQFVIMLGF